MGYYVNHRGGANGFARRLGTPRVAFNDLDAESAK